MQDHITSVTMNVNAVMQSCAAGLFCTDSALMLTSMYLF